MKIEQIQEVTNDFDGLVALADSDGFGSIRLLVDEYRSGSNRFDQQGEGLFGVYADQTLVGIGGLNVDPYEPDRRVGRLRRFFVAPVYRRCGVGALLIQRLESFADGEFSVVQLFTPSLSAGAFYEAMGYERCSGYKVSHAKSIGR